MMRLFDRPGLASLVAGCIAFSVYLATLNPGLDFIDSGELATVAGSLGIAHPSGYPLFTLVGWVFARLPIAPREILRVNLMAALFCAVGCALFLLVFRRIILLTEKKPLPPHAATASAMGGALLLAFSATYWSQAVAVEVYSLHLVLVGAVLLLFIRTNTPLPLEDRCERCWYAFAFVVGLAFTNHMTTILLAPGLLFLYFTRQGGGAKSWTRLLRMGIPFVAGLSLYVYLPLRAGQSPVLNWGNVVTPERFWWHVTGAQYQVWIFSSTAVAGRQFDYFLRGLPGQFSVAGLPLALGGFVALWLGNRRLAIGLLLLLAGCVAYAINYDIHDIDSYFLLAYVSIATAASAGCAALWRLASSGPPWRQTAVTILVASVGIIPLLLNYRECDESADYLVEDYTTNMFASLQPDAVILSYQWDYWVSAAYYFQIIEGKRPDVVVIDKELLRRSWYLKQLGNRHPWLIASSRWEVDAFLREVDKFEHGLPYDPALIQARYVAMIGAFIRNSMKTRPVYVTAEIEPEFTAPLQRIPEGLAFRLSSGPGVPPAPMPQFIYRPFPRQGRLEDVVRRFYADAYLSRGEYLLAYLHDAKEARNCLERANSFEPFLPRARRLSMLLPPLQ